MKYLSPADVDKIHDQILTESGGLPGVSPDRSLESVLYRVENNYYYGKIQSLEDLAGMYAYAIATGHPYNDGNKRTAVISMIVFLSLNGKSFIASDNEILNKIVDVADNRVSQKSFLNWVKSNCQ